MKIKLKEYLLLNQTGIFPGPGESEEAFNARIELLRKPIDLPGRPLEAKDWEEAHRITISLFDMKPMWVPAFYENKKLSCWEAAAIWDCEGRSLVQLRQKLSRGRWGLIQRGEVLSHEAAHAARMAFRENRFEEILCYQTSRLVWRKWLGPLFRQPWEATLCAVVAALGCCLGILGLTTLGLILPWLPFVFFLLRLSRDQHTFYRCLAKLRSLLIEPDQALAVALRLTDREIAFFANADEERAMSYIQDQKELRWQVILTCFSFVMQEECDEGNDISLQSVERS